MPQYKDLSIERIAGAPYPYGMVAAPHGGAVAWIYNERGARNIWVAEPSSAASYQARRVTAYAGDDGMDIADLRWSGDGAWLVYTRGGDGGGRDAVNPLSLAAGPKAGEIWAIPLGGGALKRLGAGYSSCPGPKGDIIVFLKDGQPFIATIAGGEAVPLFRDRGRVSGLSWSPGGERLAFVSLRGTHSLIGVYDHARQSVSWMSPGIDRDQMPIWSPDGSRIAFIRAASGQERVQGLNREGIPWEIWIADAATGAGRKIWAAKPGIGSCFRELFNSAVSLLWGAGDRLIFPWEVTGWVRLYAVSAEGGDARLLTPGQSEIFAAVLTPERGRIIYAGNEGDLDRRHLWEVPIDGEAPRQLTSGAGIEDFPVIGETGALFAVKGEARVPLRPVLIAGEMVTELSPQAMPADFPSAELVEPELVTFQAADGRTVHGQLFIPHGVKAGAPGLLFFHGGPTNRQAFAAWDSFETHSHLYEANQFLAAGGYVVLSVNFRGGAGYGLDFREAHGFGTTGASELNDIIGAASYLRQRPEVDAARLGIWGGSYGGRMASLGMARAPEFFVAGVDYAGVHDMSIYYGKELGDPAALKLAYESSAIAHLDSWKAPVLLIIGDGDFLLPQTIELAAKLRARGIPVDQLMIPDEVHFLLRHQSWKRTFQATRDYLDRHLMPALET
ncbi:MAG TPA: prolyl oligopeptidase family serine peptidase [Aliidongia sp.]|nr:prolyl oligopeptidase family serine peptidase [Aliidongia sp.]